ncbi:dienelactone hydrolase family protein [Desulfobacula sp.]|uniref:dienelactone hydrolase family protein n=1 Tax=Desulfobacula sp. TaxID=2593537 RepID=UPI0025BE6EE3|nr:dienelactone hydrolase family protein [Desulfobacula sp.]MBC2705953.1 dienelactone hydrolase family protein [Desulfobacula sp.]
MNQDIIRLHDHYIEEGMDRRDFLKKLTILTGGTASALAFLPMLDYSHAHAETISRDDPRLNTDYLDYPGKSGNIRAYFARKKIESKQPGVIVIHENRGLNPHIEDVIRRMALEGFTALAPDALSPMGGTPSDPDEARDLIRKLDSKQTVQNFIAAAQYLKTHPKTTGRVGVIGFCWGGGLANQLAVQTQDIQASVPFYGMQPVATDVPKIKSALLLHYAGLDERINKDIPDFEAALKSAGIDYKLYMYDGANHAFHNDTSASRYNPDAANLAWKRTIEFLSEKLIE